MRLVVYEAPAGVTRDKGEPVARAEPDNGFICFTLATCSSYGRGLLAFTVSGMREVIRRMAHSTIDLRWP